MKVFTRNYRMESSCGACYGGYLNDLKPCVLDIETSGLSRGSSKVVLVGLLTPCDSGVLVTQFLAENHYEEHKVLEATLDFLEREQIDCLITYNGLAFDLPFLNARIEQNFTGEPIRIYHFDLYRFIKLATDLKSRLDSLRQMAVEDYYGIFSDRNDTITGRESVAMFDEYSLTGNSTLEKIILTHNREDVTQLHRLMHLVPSDVEDMHTAMASYGFPIKGAAMSVRPSIKKTRGSAQDILRICGDQIKSPISAAFFPDIDSPLSATFNAETAMFEIELPIEKFPDNVINYGAHDPRYYLDADSLGLDFSDDTDYVNGYLVLTPRTVNLAAEAIVKACISRLFC